MGSAAVAGVAAGLVVVVGVGVGVGVVVVEKREERRGRDREGTRRRPKGIIRLFRFFCFGFPKSKPKKTKTQP